MPIDPASFTNAFNVERDRGFRNQMYKDQQAQQALQNQRVAASDAREQTVFDQSQQDRGQLMKQQALARVGSIAQKALTITDPAQRKGFLQQTIPGYAQDFAAIGSDTSKLDQMLQLPDDQLAGMLQQVAQFAPEAKPIEAAAGTNLIQRQPDGSYKNVYSAPGKVSYEDAGDRKVAVDSTTGARRSDIPDIKKGLPPSAQAPESMLSPQGIDMAAQRYLLEGKLPTGLGRGASTINAKILTRAAQIAQDNGDDAKSAVLNRYAFQATQKAQTEALKSFTSGKNGNTVRSLNVAVQHLDQLSQLGTALNNGDVPAINKLSNTIAKAFGVAAPNTFDAMKKVVTDELVKAIIGAGGGVADREEAAATINAAGSPAQLSDVIANYKGLMAGQLNGLRQQYREGTGRDDFERFLLPTTKAELEQHDSATGGGAAAKAPAAGTVEDGYRFKGGDPSVATNWERVQ